MKITNLNELKKDATFLLLNKKQANWDLVDAAMGSNPFTRSPIHAIQFLILYAGLNSQQKDQVIHQLNYSYITKEKLDALVDNIEWESLLAVSDNTLSINMEVPNPNALLESLKSCPKLYAALNSLNSLIKIKPSETNEIIVESKVYQEVKWSVPFEEKDGYWLVKQFSLSPAFQEILQNMSAGATKNISAFNIKKGSSREIQLKIKCPKDAAAYNIKHETDVNSGIYAAFVRIENVYGLERIDDVRVRLKSEAQFSKEGAFAKQTQASRFLKMSRPLKPQTPTVITVKDINVFFNGIDVFVKFISNLKSSYFCDKYFIELKADEHNQNHILLLSGFPDPWSAFEFYESAGSEDGKFVLEKSTGLLSFFGNTKVKKSEADGICERRGCTIL